MPGRMRGKQVTVRKLRIERVDLDRNLLLIRGAIPGSTNGFLVVRHTELDESKLPPRVEDDNNQETETSLIEVSTPEAPVAEAEEEKQ